MSENNAISSRTTRLNSIIMNRPESLSKTQKEICEGISREGLLDALFVLYDECNKDVMKKKSSHIVEFVNKCNFCDNLLSIFSSLTCFYLYRSHHCQRNQDSKSQYS